MMKEASVQAGEGGIGSAQKDLAAQHRLPGDACSPTARYVLLLIPLAGLVVVGLAMVMWTDERQAAYVPLAGGLDARLIGHYGTGIAIALLVAALSAGGGYHWRYRTRVLRRLQRLEVQAERKDRALALAMRELDALSYVASHDLRTPLRSIDGFCQAIAEEQGARLDEGARERLARVRRAAQRMDVIIDEMIALSRISRSETEVVEIDITAMAREVAAGLMAADPGRQVECRIEEHLRGRADPRMLRTILANLLDNAFKFTSQRAHADIFVGRFGSGGDEIYFVRDNGAGFNVSHAGRLFEAFRRLHRPEEFPGAGVGLAAVQRLVARHGGRIWAEAAPGQGATFFFTLSEASR